jgi:Tol biopolymer transport system component
LIKSKLVYAGYINDQLEILSLSEGSSDPELVIQSTLDDIFPIWSPDGKSLAFLRTGSFSTFHLRDPKTDLYLLLDQTLINFTVEMNLFISEMVWSPNSKYIAFSAHDKEPEPLEDDSLNIYIVDINTRQIAKITDTSGVGCRSISWSPDSRELVSACRGGMVSGLIITNRDGSNLWFTELWAVDGVEWLPSGNSLSFTGGWDPLGSLRAEYMRQRGAQEDNGYFSWYERLESLDFQQKPIHAFGWFPADDNLFLIQSEDLIQIVDLSQQQVISILGDYHDLEGQFTWGPDGQQIAFAYFDGHDAEIGILNLKTLLFSKLTDNLVDDLMPSWQPLLGN